MTFTSHATRVCIAASMLSFGAISTPVHADFSMSVDTLKVSTPSPVPVQRDLQPMDATDAVNAKQPAPLATTAAPVAPAAAVIGQTVASVEAKPDETLSMKPVESWLLSPTDGTMRAVLGKWASRAGWQLSWEASVDVPLTVSASFQGDFRSAVKQLFSSLSANEVNLNGLLYTRNRVLRVTEIGQRSQ